MFTWNQCCSLIIWKLICALINWFLQKRSHYDSIVHKLLNHILWFRQKKSSKHIVADHQYFSWMHISSLLLQLIFSRFLVLSVARVDCLMIEIVSSGFLDSKSDVIFHLGNTWSNFKLTIQDQHPIHCKFLLGLGLWRSSIPDKWTTKAK